MVEAARECLDKAIAIVKPGMQFRDPGNVIEAHSKTKGTSVVTAYCGHGVNTLFHCAPNVPHYANNKAVGTAKEGMCFTIEPMINLGSYKDKTWPDDWTSTTADGKLSAQFGMLCFRGEIGLACDTDNCLSRTYAPGDEKWRGNPHCAVTKQPRWPGAYA